MKPRKSRHALRFEALCRRELLAADDWVHLIEPARSIEQSANLDESSELIRMDEFRQDARFAGIDGTGFRTVIIDTGIDLDHPSFGPDNDGDGVGDRIVYHYDFHDDDDDASDVVGHGTHVAGIAAGMDANYEGVATGAEIIALKVFGTTGSASSVHTRDALQWVVDNAAAWNVASINLSLGINSNDQIVRSSPTYGSQLTQIADMGIIIAAAAGNDFGAFNGVAGVSAPSSDAAAIAISASSDTSATPAGYSQRHPALTDVFAPGSRITAAQNGGGYITQDGTSMATPHVAGIAALMQQLATQELGRQLSPAEFSELMKQTGSTLFDPAHQFDYQLVDVMAMGERILEMRDSSVDLRTGSIATTTTDWTTGQTYTVSATIHNDGTTPSVPVVADLILSPDAIIHPTGDIELDSVNLPAIAAGGSTTVSFHFTLPEPNSDLYIAGRTSYFAGVNLDVDAVQPETNEGNNRNGDLGADRLAINLVSPPGDLIGDTISLPSEGVRGKPLSMGFSIANQGAGPIQSHTVDVYLSVDGTIDAGDDYKLGSVQVGRILGGGTSQPESLTVTLPAFDDSFWDDSVTDYTIGLIVDPNNSVSESNETNNANVGIGVDLGVLPITIEPTRLRGTVFVDANEDQLWDPPLLGNFERSVASAQSVGPRTTASFTMDDLPQPLGAGRLIIEAYGDLDEAHHNAVLTVDGMFSQTVLDGPVAQPGFPFSLVTQSIDLEGPDWVQAIADGSIDIQLAFGNYGAYVGTATSIRITLQYEALDLQLASGQAQVVGQTLANRSTTTQIPLTPKPIGDGTLTLLAMGDTGGAEETALVDLEGLFSATMLDEGGGDPNFAASIDSVTVPLADLEALLADGVLEPTVTFNAATNLNYPFNFYAIRLDYPIAAESGLGNVTLRLDADNDGTFELETTSSGNDPATAANDTGRFGFVDVGDGDMTLRLVPPLGFEPSFPASGNYQFNLVNGSQDAEFAFGVRPLGGPRLIESIPADDQPHAPPNTFLLARFDEPIVAGAGSIHLRNADDDSLVQSFAIDGPEVSVEDQTLRIQPSNPLVDGQSYYVTLDAGVLLDTQALPFVGAESADFWNFTVQLREDFGDAPSSYGVTLADDGARHAIQGPRLGQTRGHEADSSGDAQAAGDAGDDGAMFGSFAFYDDTAALNLDLQNASQAIADAWLDANQDGVWSADEKILDGVPLIAGLQTINFDLPAGTLGGTTFARVRVSTDGVAGPGGAALDGEVEDYLVDIGNLTRVEAIVNGGDAQRSDLRSVRLQFNGPVTYGTFDIFDVQIRSESGTRLDRTQTSNGQNELGTYIDFTFPDSNLASGGTLNEGRYQIIFDTAAFMSNGFSVDGDGDGVAGGVFRFGIDEADNFFRLYGDSNGDSSVDLLDFADFRNSFGSVAGDDTFRRGLDANADNTINLLDFADFRTNFGRSI
ncbi:MAG: S8 family serine peptidase [Planctomycetota bacterium]